MMIYDKIVESVYEPQSTNVLWLRPTEKGFAFYRYKNGRWEVLRVMNDEGTSSPYDDQPYDLSGQGSTPGPNTVGTEQLIDGAVELEDLHDDVKGKIQKTYDVSDESLLMDFDIQP